jgi:hypothetical protein
MNHSLKDVQRRDGLGNNKREKVTGDESVEKVEEYGNQG